INAVVRRYETRNKTAGIEMPSSKSRVDWRRTKREIILLDSDDESSRTTEEEEPTASEDEADEDEIPVKNSLSDQEEKRHSGEVGEDGEDECVMPAKRKRLNSSVLYDSDESEDNDTVVRKVFAKRHCIMDEDESSREQSPNKNCPTGNVSTDRRQKVFAKLKELARQRATWRSCSSENCEDSNAEEEIEEEPLSHLPLSPAESSETESDSMKNFIVEEEGDSDDNTEDVNGENQPQQKELPNASNSKLLAYYFPHLSRCDHYVHFKRIVKAFLINAIDDTFLSSLY
ncbi:CCD82 protein, partial [Alcedo cyanopectus]|nr:CCD82 protein [Ceyx cyanopectus]